MTALIIDWPHDDAGKSARRTLFRGLLGHALAYAAARPPRGDLTSLMRFATLAALHRRHLEDIVAAPGWNIDTDADLAAARPLAQGLCLRLARRFNDAAILALEETTLDAYDHAIGLSSGQIADICSTQRTTLSSTLRLIMSIRQPHLC